MTNPTDSLRHGLFLSLLLITASAPAATRFEGEAIQGGLLIGHTEPGARVEVDGQAVRVSPEGLFLVGLDRDARSVARIRVVLKGEEELMELPVKRRDYDIQRIEGLPPRKVEPNPEDEARIAADIAAAKRARERDDARTDFLTGWSWPVVGRISGVYGSQRILNGQSKQPHYGVDIAAPEGTPVRAPADGLVTLAHPDMFYSGATLILDHGHRLSSAFLHLSRILVKEGQQVRKGEVIAEVGASGRVTGAHLDWRMKYHDRNIDTARLAGPMPAATTGP